MFVPLSVVKQICLVLSKLQDSSVATMASEMFSAAWSSGNYRVRKIQSLEAVHF